MDNGVDSHKKATQTVDDEFVAQLSDVSVVLGGFPALAHVDLQISSQELIHLRGANGAGKSTLLRLLAGLHRPFAGTSSVLNCDLSLPGDRQLLRSRVGLVSHEPNLYADLSAMENLKFWSRMQRSSVDSSIAACEELGLDVSSLARTTQDLSHGQQRKLALALMIARRSSLWLLDEPFSGLDSESRSQLESIISTAVSSGVSVVYASHADSFSTKVKQRIVDLNDGSIGESITLPSPSAVKNEMTDAV